MFSKIGASRISMTAVRALAFGLMMSSLSACPGQHFRPPEVRGATLSSQESRDVLTRVSQKTSEVQSFRALSNTEFRYRGDANYLRHVFAFERPALLRVETFPTNANFTIALLTANSENIVLLEPGEKKAVKSSSAAELIKSYLYLPLDEESLMSLLTGRLPGKVIQSMENSGNTRLVSDTSSGKLSLVKGDFHYYAALDAVTLDLYDFQIRDEFSGRIELEVAFSNYIDWNGVRVPSSIKLAMPADNVEAKFELESFKVNQQLPAQLFQTRIPSDFDVESLD
jgi:outer membrane lipoprotein-sorting protein